MLQALANHRGFVVYRLAPLPNGKTDKIPIDGVTGYNSDAQNTATWLTPDLAEAFAREWAPIYKDGTGVGILIYEGSQLFCIDIDGCVIDGQPNAFALAIIDRFPGAVVEVSASGKGLHIFGVYRGILPPHKTKNTHWHVELYTKARFIALTGKYYRDGYVGTDCTDALTAFAAEYFPQTGGAFSGEWTDGPAEGWDFIRDDDEMLKWAHGFRDAKSAFGGKAPVWALMDAHESIGQWFPPNSHGQLYDASSADQALANFFAWATGNDCERVARLLQRTALKRSKWEREDYFNGTVAKACTGTKPWPTARAIAQSTQVAPASTVPWEAPPRQEQHVVADGVVPQVDGAVIPEVPAAMPGSDGVIPRGGMLFTADQQKVFAGLTYVEDVHMVMMPDGDLLDQKRFDLREPLAGRDFQMVVDGSNPSDSAWKAFTAGMIQFPKVRGQYFEPREEPGAIMVREGKRYVNSWRPIVIDATPGNYQWFIDHLHKLLPPATHGNDAHILLQFLKFMVQHKGVKAAWFPFLQGVEGNGKSFINDTMQYCLGEFYTHTPRPNELAGRFNSAFYGKLFIRIEDIQLADARHIWETLKPMVDGKRLEIEYKGVDKVAREVCFNMLATSNFKDGIPVTSNDRRVAPFFCAQQVEADLERDGLTVAYFQNMWTTAAAGGWAAVLHYLSTDPIDPAYNPAVEAIRAPRTSSTFAAKAVTMGSVEQEILEAVEISAEGFAGGWISSAALDRMLKQNGKDKVLSLNKRSAMLGALGYIPHPGLTDGRVATPLPDGTRPRLFVKSGHLTATATDKALIRQLYLNAQGSKM
jgi:hypothetical protein